MRTDVGAMDRLAILQRPSGSAGFETVDEVWGALSFGATVGETIQGGGLAALAGWQWVIWHRTDIRAEWRIQDKEDGRVFQIQAYGDPDGRRKVLRLYCAEVQ